MKLIQLIFSLTAPGCNTAVSASRSNPAFVASRSWSRNMHQVGGAGQTTSLLAATSDEETENDDISINNSSTSNSTSSSSIKRGTKFNSPEINEYTRQQISKIFGSSNESSEFVPLDFAGIWSRPKLVTDASSSSDSDDTKKKNSDGNHIDIDVDIEAILLSSRDQCKDIADIYKQYLTKSNEQDESLSENDEDDDDDDASISIAKALPIPLAPSTFTPAIKLLSQTYSCTPLSKSVLLSFNTLFLNRDNGLFDNLPWSTWSIDPTLTERDAANNVVQDKYAMGKRVAYQRFMGKDWQGRSLSLGNLANRIKYTLEGEDGISNRGEDDGNYRVGDVVDEDDDEVEMMVSLSQRWWL